MTFNTKDLRDGHLPLIERIDVALRRVTNGEGQMRVPVEATDPDIVLHNCRDHIVDLKSQLSTQADEMIRFTNLANDYAAVSQQLARCESALRLSLAGTEQHYFASPARIDDVRAALADAQAQLAEARNKLKECDESTDFVQELREAEQSTLANTQRLLGVAQTQIDAKDKRIAELEQLATLTPIKVGDISITLGLTETGEARMTFDGADDATLAVVAGKFALAMQATMDGAKEVPNA